MCSADGGSACGGKCSDKRRNRHPALLRTATPGQVRLRSPGIPLRQGFAGQIAGQAGSAPETGMLMRPSCARDRLTPPPPPGMLAAKETTDDADGAERMTI